MRVTKKLNLNIFLGLVVMGFQSNVMVFHGFCLVQIVVLGEPVKTTEQISPSPPLNRKSPKILLKEWVKRAKLAFLAKNSCFLADYFLTGIGDPPPTPLRRKLAK